MVAAAETCAKDTFEQKRKNRCSAFHHKHTRSKIYYTLRMYVCAYLLKLTARVCVWCATPKIHYKRAAAAAAQKEFSQMKNWVIFNVKNRFPQFTNISVCVSVRRKGHNKFYIKTFVVYLKIHISVITI